MTVASRTQPSPDAAPCRDLAALAASTDNGTFLFAVGHVAAGRVGAITRRPAGGSAGEEELTAKVADTPRRSVRLTADTATCACPDGKRRRSLCEHALAVALTDVVAVTGISLTDLTARWMRGDLLRAEPARASAPVRAVTVVASSSGVCDCGDPHCRVDECDCEDEDCRGECGCVDPDCCLDECDCEDEDCRGECGCADPDCCLDEDEDLDEESVAPGTSEALRRFVDGLSADQARSLLLALASDLPEVDDALTGLAGGPGREAARHRG